ncbi:MAG: hypothetical protein FWE03_05025 [Firmicutes bacterium]|nr:hypothetical protein [Bacillota bacterium]
MDREYKKLKKELGQKLVELSKEAESEENLYQAKELIKQGAEVNFNRCRPMFFACKGYNFSLIRYFIGVGALAEPLSRNYLSGMCQRGAFDEEKEQKFFELIDLAILKTGFSKEYILHYFKTMLLEGNVEKAKTIGDKYGVSLRQMLEDVPLHIIIECLELKREESLELINLYQNRMQEAFDASIAGGRDKAIEYIYARGFDLIPDRDSILKAIMNGYMSTIHLLNIKGVDMRGDWCLVTAARVFSLRPEPLKFLLDKYVKDISEAGMQALKALSEQENNEALKEFLLTR